MESEYEGFWKDDKKHGKGKLTLYEQNFLLKFIEGIWDASKLIEVVHEQNGSIEEL